jgi:hypothetical protein
MIKARVALKPPLTSFVSLLIFTPPQIKISYRVTMKSRLLARFRSYSPCKPPHDNSHNKSNQQKESPGHGDCPGEKVEFDDLSILDDKNKNQRNKNKKDDVFSHFYLLSVFLDFASCSECPYSGRAPYCFSTFQVGPLRIYVTPRSRPICCTLGGLSLNQTNNTSNDKR